MYDNPEKLTRDIVWRISLTINWTKKNTIMCPGDIPYGISGHGFWIAKHFQS